MSQSHSLINISSAQRWGQRLKSALEKYICTNGGVNYKNKPTAAGEDVGLSGVHSNATDVVRVGLKHVNTLQGVVVEHTNLHVILPREKKYIYTVLLFFLQNLTISNHKITL